MKEKFIKYKHIVKWKSFVNVVDRVNRELKGDFVHGIYYMVNCSLLDSSFVFC